MTNKRFENRNKRFKPIKSYGKAVNEVFIKDTINDWYIHTEDDVVDLLNSLSKENEQLKKENRMLKKDLNKLYNLLMDKGMRHNELQDVLWGLLNE